MLTRWIVKHAGRSAAVPATVALAVLSFPFVFAQSAPEVTLDQEQYTWTEKVHITVRSPNHAGTGAIHVTVSTDGHALYDYELEEAVPGIFLGEVTLTGFGYDAYGDGAWTTHPETSGHGPKDGRLEAQRDDTLTILFEDGGVSVSDSAPIRWNAGAVVWDGGSCQEGADCIVTVYDPDMNIHSDRPDHLYEIFLFSDSDPVGISVVMVETGDDTGIFSWHYTITTSGASVGQKLLARYGDSIGIKYVDRTAPSPSAVGEFVDVTDAIRFDQGPDAGWSLSGIRQAIASNGSDIQLDNVDSYFPTINRIKDTLDALDMPYTVQNVPEYGSKKLTLTKRLAFDTSSAAEFEAVFGRDPRTLPGKFRGEVVDEAYILQNVLHKMQSCLTDAEAPYCAEEPAALAARIADKIGAHTLTESVILEEHRINRDGADAKSAADAILNRAYSAYNKTISKTDWTPMIPRASAEPASDYQYAEPRAALPEGQAPPGPYFADEISFLNGFTLGYGFGKTWSYEYDAGFPVFYVEAHVEAGLGIGLRVPIDVRVEIMRESSPGASTPHHTTLAISTKDIGEKEYSELGLPDWKVFEGKEFNSYLGPAAYVKARLFGIWEAEYEKGAPHPKSSDFVPPLGGQSESFGYTGMNLCDQFDICVPAEVLDISLYAGVNVEMYGDKVIGSMIPGDAPGVRQISFAASTQQQGPSHPMQAQDPFIVVIDGLQYHADMRFVPSLSIEITTPHVPFSVISESVEFPGVTYRDISFGPHEGTVQRYAVPEFGTLAAAIMAAALSIVALGRFSKSAGSVHRGRFPTTDS